MPKLIKSKICVRCETEKQIDEFRYAGKRIGDQCLLCRSKCKVCGCNIPNQVNFAVKYCSDDCRRVTDRLQKAERLEVLVKENPSHFKEKYILAKSNGWKLGDSERSKLYYQNHKIDPVFRSKRLKHANTYYQRHRELILLKNKSISDDERMELNLKRMLWREKRLSQMSDSERHEQMRKERFANRQTRLRQRLAKLRLDFMEIEELFNERVN